MENSEKNNTVASSPNRVINIGNNNPVDLTKFISLLEQELNIKAIKVFEEIQLGEVEKTYADIEKLNKLINYKPTTSLKLVLKSF